MSQILQILLILTAAFGISFCPAQAQLVSPVEYGQKLYENDKQGEGAKYSDNTTRLFAQCEKRAKRHDDICLDFNIFIMGQDTSGPLKDFKVVSKKVGEKTAVIVATFVNGKLPTTITMNILKSGSSWVIDDMTGRQDLADGKSNCAHLIAILKGQTDT
jgi:hypothetical protein